MIDNAYTQHAKAGNPAKRFEAVFCRARFKKKTNTTKPKIIENVILTISILFTGNIANDIDTY